MSSSRVPRISSRGSLPMNTDIAEGCSAAAVFFASFCMDLVLYGQDGAKLLYIISDAPQQIAQRILQELDIGVTYIQGSGAYSGRGKKVLMCVMRKQLYPRVREVVKEEDPQAFMIVTSATEIYGQGYKNYFNV